MYVVCLDVIYKLLIRCMKVNNSSIFHSFIITIKNLFFKIETTTSASPVYEYEKISPSPVRSPYENNTQHRLQQQTPFYISFESKSSDAISTVSNTIPIIPSFQRQFPTITVAILGFFELFSGVIILAFELYTFDLALGLWCGGFYTLAGIAIVVLGLSCEKNLETFSLKIASFFLTFQLQVLI